MERTDLHCFNCIITVILRLKHYKTTTSFLIHEVCIALVRPAEKKADGLGLVGLEILVWALTHRDREDEQRRGASRQRLIGSYKCPGARQFEYTVV